MKAAVIYKPFDIRVEKKEIPVPRDDEVLIRIRACGVCGTDNSLIRPIILSSLATNFPERSRRLGRMSASSSKVIG